MLGTRLIWAVVFGLAGATIGLSLGVAGSFLGLISGATVGWLVFGLIGLAMGAFAARDMNDLIALADAKHPFARPRILHIRAAGAKVLRVSFGLILLLNSRLWGLIRK